jgi:hypothetical protein
LLILTLRLQSLLQLLPLSNFEKLSKDLSHSVLSGSLEAETYSTGTLSRLFLSAILVEQTGNFAFYVDVIADLISIQPTLDCIFDIGSFDLNFDRRLDIA